MSKTEIVIGFGKLPEVEQVPIYSTAHITKNDDELLSKQSENSIPSVVSIDYGYGYLVHLNKDGYDELDNMPFSSQFKYIYRKLTESGYDYVKFDCDGPKVEYLKEFVW